MTATAITTDRKIFTGTAHGGGTFIADGRFLLPPLSPMPLSVISKVMLMPSHCDMALFIRF
jgi:hypothetical protein